MNPKVSVIVPNYNHSEFLAERINSILIQTYSNFEIILLDDYSTDSSRNILNKYSKNPKVSYIIFNDSNSGNTFLQWEKGFKKARGEYIWIAESDDVALPDFLEKNMLALEKNNSAVMSFCGSFFIDQEGKKIKKPTWDQWKESGEMRIFDGKEYIKRNLSFRNNIYNASMVVFKKECYNNVNTSYQKLKYAGDWLFWINISRQGDVIEIREKLNLFRQHNNKVTNFGAFDGRSLNDELHILSILLQEENIKKSTYLSTILKGRMYKKIQRGKYSSSGIKSELFRQAYLLNNISEKHFIVERFNKILSALFPFWLLTDKKYKLK